MPDVLLLDEPFAGLDAEVRSNLLEDALSALRSSTRATLVVVHDRAEAWALADRLLILLDGRLAASGPPRELLERPPSVAVARFLGFDGSLEDGHELLLTRPAHVALDPAGPLEARVTRAVPLEDGVRLELELDHGRLYAVSPLPAPRPGDDGAHPDRRWRALPAVGGEEPGGIRVASPSVRGRPVPELLRGRGDLQITPFRAHRTHRAASSMWGMRNAARCSPRAPNVARCR